MSGQFVAHVLFGWALTYPLMGPIVKSSAHGWMLRFPVAMTIATFFGVQASNWRRPSKAFHDVMAQPAPHGSYLRRSIKVVPSLIYITFNIYRNISQSGGTRSAISFTRTGIHSQKCTSMINQQPSKRLTHALTTQCIDHAFALIVSKQKTTH